MSEGFERLRGEDAYIADDRRYYGRTSLDMTDSLSYDDYRAKGDATSTAALFETKNLDGDERAENNAPLRQSLKQYSKLVWWCLAMSSAILYSGYDAGVLSSVNTLPAFQRDFGEWSPKPADEVTSTDPETMEWLIPAKWLSIWEGIGPLGAIIGAALGGWLLDRIGRRLCLMLGSFLGALAILTLLVSNKPANKDGRRIMILVGKIVQGLGLGIIKIETYTYLSEIVPVSLKGAVMALVPIFTLIGQLIGAVVCFAVESNDTQMSYLIALGSQWAVALPPFILAIFLPESPVYLLTKKDSQKALNSLTRLFGRKHNSMAMLHKMERTIEEEAKSAKKARYIECFNADNRRRTLIVIFASTIETLWGLPLLATVSYFLQQLGMSASKAILFLIAGIVIGLIANIGSAWTLSHIGRRRLTITTFLIACGLWTVMGFAGIKQSDATPWIAGGIMTAIVVTCGLGAWPASYAIMGETSSLRLRSKSQALGSLSSSLIGMGMSAALPYFFNHDAADLGAKTGFVFTALSLFGAVMTYFFVPELKGRSVQEIDHLFQNKVSARGSTAWRDTHEEVPLSEA